MKLFKKKTIKQSLNSMESAPKIKTLIGLIHKNIGKSILNFQIIEMHMKTITNIMESNYRDLNNIPKTTLGNLRKKLSSALPADFKNKIEAFNEQRNEIVHRLVHDKNFILDDEKKLTLIHEKTIYITNESYALSKFLYQISNDILFDVIKNKTKYDKDKIKSLFLNLFETK
jgi:hypothetical protein